MTTAFDLNATTLGLPSEGELPSLVELADEPSQGAWKPGWYKAEIIDGYASRKGHQFSTSDIVSKAGDSRNLRICFTISNGAETRNLQHQLNYRFEDLTAERLQTIKAARTDFKGVKEWPGAAKDLQRSSIAIGHLGQFAKALGVGYSATNVGINPAPLVGRKVDVRLGIDENGFNDIREFAKAGEKAK